MPSSDGRTKLFSAWIFLLLLSSDLPPEAAAAAGSVTVGRPSTDFSGHRRATARFQDARSKRDVPSTKSSAGHLEDVTVVLDFDDGTRWPLNLRLNDLLLPEGYFEKYQDQVIKATRKKPHEKSLFNIQPVRIIL